MNIQAEIKKLLEAGMLYGGNTSQEKLDWLVGELKALSRVELPVKPANGNTRKIINEFFDDYFLDIDNCFYVDSLTFKNKINFAALIVLQLKIDLLSRLSV